jgi:hypothetical protein
MKHDAHYFREFRIRPDMVESLKDYFDYGVPPGDFLRAILENRLVESVAAADDDNLRNIQAYAEYLYNEAPRGTWGSAENVDNHIRRKFAEREERRKKNEA